MPLVGKDKEKGIGAPAEGMEDEICFLGLGILAHTRHASYLDQMHITKNILESLLGTLMNMPERTMDGPKARKDLEFFNIRKDLQMPGKRSSEETETETETEDRGKK